jgi:histone deacetylase 1/2
MVLHHYKHEIIVISSSSTAIDRLIQGLHHEFIVKDLGPLHYFLGIEVAHRSGGLILTQRQYALDLLRRLGMLKCKAADTPMFASVKLFPADSRSLDDVDANTYRSVVGGLQYLTHTHPDLSFAVNRVCQFVHGTLDHWSAVKRILRFVHGTLDHGLLLRPLIRCKRIYNF